MNKLIHLGVAIILCGNIVPLLSTASACSYNDSEQRYCGAECASDDNLVDATISVPADSVNFWRSVQVEARCGTVTATGCAGHGDCEAPQGYGTKGTLGCYVTTGQGVNVNFACEAHHCVPSRSAQSFGACMVHVLGIEDRESTRFSGTISAAGEPSGMACQDRICYEQTPLCAIGALRVCGIGLSWAELDQLRLYREALLGPNPG